MPYCGRFAPSPSGPLHFGSLIAATGSYADAIHHGGKWLLRIEDLDTPRIQADAATDIVALLHACGMRWHGEVIYQSQRLPLYADALHQLQQRGWVYPCNCPRSRVKNIPYDGHCRGGMSAGKTNYSLRLRTDIAAAEIDFDDLIRGTMQQDIAYEVGDFILKRSDGVIAYQLAVVVDDAAHAITHVVRGSDLYDNTPRQIYLQRLLGYTQPQYLHLPVLIDQNGYKLSKQNHAPAVNPEHAQALLYCALQVLGQAPPPALRQASIAHLWEWTAHHWQRAKIPPLSEIVFTDELTRP
jgi:glutamyl-Q tRNA(Asp) synthetase